MKERLPLFLGVFSVMALSNAIVPILATFGDSTISQGAIFAAYFLGAFLFVLPSGFLSDLIGEIPLVRAGMVLTVISGVLLMTTTSPAPLIAFRFIEGIGAGLFIPPALSILNARPDHQTGSGYFMSSLNFGLVAGLIGGGLLVEGTGMLLSGMVFFTVLSVVPAILCLFLRPPARPLLPGESARETARRLLRVTRDYSWLWISTVVLLGITGGLTALYPEFSDLSPGNVGFVIASMSLATAVTILFISRVILSPIPAIRLAAVVMAAAVMLTFLTPLSFVLVGALAGVVMIAQLSFLATAEPRQGVVMGLFSTASYGGMSLLSFVAGTLAEVTSFFSAFLVMALSAVLVAITIGWCRCRPGGGVHDEELAPIDR
jgi:MFS family permease